MPKPPIPAPDYPTAHVDEIGIGRGSGGGDLLGARRAQPVVHALDIRIRELTRRLKPDDSELVFPRGRRERRRRNVTPRHLTPKYPALGCRYSTTNHDCLSSPEERLAEDRGVLRKEYCRRFQPAARQLLRYLDCPGADRPPVPHCCSSGSALPDRSPYRRLVSALSGTPGSRSSR